MNDNPTNPAGGPPAGNALSNAAPALAWKAAWLWLLAAAIPISLLWDYSWECTVGIDLVWAPAHAATYLAVTLAGLTALALAAEGSLKAGRANGVRLGRFQAPLGVWLTAWGAAAFLAAMLLDRWWRAAYGLGAGIWHPPQILKAVAFFAVVAGVWLFCSTWQNLSAPGKGWAGAVAFSGAGGLVLAMITVVTLVSIYPNRQHAAWFYKVACSAYPLMLVALATAGKLRFPATLASLVYLGLMCIMVWLPPIFPARPQVGPIYNPLDHMMPPPFPLLLVLPALALDVLFRKWDGPAFGVHPLGCQTPPHSLKRGHRAWLDSRNENRLRTWLQAGAAGLIFFCIFAAAQWSFAEFLLTRAADNWFFAGGGEHWPFFLKLDPAARQMFWETRRDEMNFTNGLMAAGFAILSARLGLWIGAGMKRLQR